MRINTHTNQLRCGFPGSILNPLICVATVWGYGLGSTRVTRPEMTVAISKWWSTHWVLGATLGLWRMGQCNWQKPGLGHAACLKKSTTCGTNMNMNVKASTYVNMDQYGDYFLPVRWAAEMSEPWRSEHATIWRRCSAASLSCLGLVFEDGVCLTEVSHASPSEAARSHHRLIKYPYQRHMLSDCRAAPIWIDGWHC